MKFFYRNPARYLWVSPFASAMSISISKTEHQHLTALDIITAGDPFQVFWSLDARSTLLTGYKVSHVTWLSLRGAEATRNAGMTWTGWPTFLITKNVWFSQPGITLQKGLTMHGWIPCFLLYRYHRKEHWFSTLGGFTVYNPIKPKSTSMTIWTTM